MPTYKINEDIGTDSDEEGQVKNVSHLVLRPVGHTGRAKKGHLIFDAAFESGNLGRVDRINDFEYDLFLRPDVANPRYRFWFNFTIENVQRGQRIIMNIVNMGRRHSLFFEGWTPVIRSSSKLPWKRIPTGQVIYYRCPRHRLRFVITILLAFETEEDVYQIALSYPYTYSRFKERLTFLEVFTSRFQESDHYLGGRKKQIKPSNVFGISSSNLLFTRRQIGSSLQNRSLELVTISSNGSKYVTKSDESCKSSGQMSEDFYSKKKVIVITSRIHPSETPSSFLCHGLIDFLISSHPVAETLRRFTIFKIIPMIAVDAVFLGNTRTSVIGFDLNRVWVNPSDVMHPLVFEAKKAIIELTGQFGEEVDVFLDIHSNDSSLGSFILGKKFQDVFRMERHVLFPKLLSKIAPDFYLDNCMYQSDPLKSGTPRRALESILPEKCNSYTLSVSFHGFYDPSTLGQRIIPYTEKLYAGLGENLVIAFADVYVTIGFIPIDPQILPFLTPKASKLHSNELKSQVLSFLNPFRSVKSPSSGRRSPKSLP